MNGAVLAVPRPKRLVVAITEGPGAVFGVRLLESLAGSVVETHLVISEEAQEVIEAQTGRDLDALAALADRVHHPRNQAAAISSGSFRVCGMVVAPCSTRSLGAISIGLAGNLVHRAADVTIKERRPLVLVVRDGPLTEIHEANLARLAGVATVLRPDVPPPWPGAIPSCEEVEATVQSVLEAFDLTDRVPSLAGR